MDYQNQKLKTFKNVFCFLLFKMEQTKTTNRKLISVEPAKDNDGSEINVYKYEVTRNGKTTTQTVKTRKTNKYKENKYNPEEDKDKVVGELIKYFNNYKYTTLNYLDEFRVMTKSNEKLKIIVDHLFTTLQVKLTQLQVKQLINTELINRMSVKISFK